MNLENDFRNNREKYVEKEEIRNLKFNEKSYYNYFKSENKARHCHNILSTPPWNKTLDLFNID